MTPTWRVDMVKMVEGLEVEEILMNCETMI
jgi:hypothetical protein